jgi:hypothetical protein
MSNYIDNTELFLTPKVNQYNNHMVMTNVMQPTQRKYINIDTCNLDSSFNSVANYTLNLPERINNVKSLCVRNIEIPMSFYNISSNLGNNYFGVCNVANGTSRTVVLTDNEYTVSSLRDEINSKLTALGSAVGNGFGDLSFNLVKNSFISSLKADGSANNGIDVTFAVDSTNNFDKYNFKNKLGWMLGFRDTSYNIRQTTRTAESIVDINSSRYLYLVIDEFTNSKSNSFLAVNTMSQIKSNIIARISLNKTTYPFGAILPANNFNGLLLTDRRSYNGKVDLQKLKVQLVHENGVPVNLNGLGFSFCLEVEYE